MKKTTESFLKYKYLKLKLRVFLAGNIECDENNNNVFANNWAAVFDNMIVASIDNEC